MRNKLTSLAVAAGILGALALPAAAAATSGTAAISAGSLALAAPSTAAFTATLDGTNQTVHADQAIDVLDQTGSGAGWNVTATSTTFTTPGLKTLANSSVTIPAAPAVACKVVSTCTVATTNVSYPYTLPAGTTAPTATKLYNAAADTGLGNQTVTAAMALAVPATTIAGAYASTWTYSLVSAP